MLFFGGMLIVNSQNKQILYGFDKIPQTLLLNPGAETTYKYHVGIPFLSANSVNANISEITVADIFRNDGVSFFGTDFNTRLRNAIDRVDGDDYAYANAQVEILNAGYKINSRDYLSVGFYSEADVFVTMPKDVFTLIDEGNAAYLNRTFSLSQVNLKADILGVLHVGLKRKLTDRLTVGGRFKIYSGALSVSSTRNSGTFTTREGTDGIYKHTISDVDFEVYSSGLYDENNKVDITAGSVFGSTFLGGNFGLGLDLGYTFYWNEQLQFSASLLDVGFISYSRDTRNYDLEGDYTFSGMNFRYDGTNTDYWGQLSEDFENRFPRGENRESYTVMRPIKVNAALSYGFGKSRNIANCHDISYKDFYDNAVGGQLHTVFRPNGARFALTGFYERKFSKHLNTKFTYTIDDFSYTNFGVGVSANIWKVNIYGMVDNIFYLTDIADANRASFQLGLNLIFN